MHHDIFSQFEQVPCDTTGDHMFDFVGSKTRVAFKKGWAKFAPAAGRTTKPNLPPVNEHYFDWIVTLTAAAAAKGTFRMAELGAGWAPWVVRGALASRQNADVNAVELLAVEADPTHFEWMQTHFRDNGLDPEDHHLLFGAAAGESGTLRFPVVDNPEENYGASVLEAGKNVPTIEVRAYTLDELLDRFSGPLDFLHVDIQGAEYDVLQNNMALLNSSVKSVMVGTHLSDELHDGLAEAFLNAGWTEHIRYARNAHVQSDFGDVTMGDGFLWYTNPAF